MPSIATRLQTSSVSRRKGFPAQYAKAVIDQYLQLGEDSERLLTFPTPVIEAIDGVMKGARSILALTNPTPGYMGSSYSDVQDLFADDGGSVTEQQDLLVKAVNKSVEWKRRVMAYWSEAADDFAVVPAYNTHLDFWASSKSDVVVRAQVDQVLGDITTWSNKLRPGARDALIEVLVQWCKKQWASEQELLDVESPARVLIAGTCRLSKNTTVHEIQNTLTTKVAQAARDHALADFAQEIHAWVTNLDTLPQLYDKFKLVEQIPKPDDVINDCHNFRGFLCKRMLDIFSDASASKSDIDRIRKQNCALAICCDITMLLYSHIAT